MRNIMNESLKDMSFHYEQKLRSFSYKIQYLTKEIQNQDKVIQNLLAANTPQSLVQNLAMKEKNKYKIWYLLQSEFGNQYFFDVFENPELQYGINYKEIDKFLAVCGARGREFIRLKETLEQQIVELVEKTKVIIDQYHKDVEEYKSKITESAEQQLEEINQIKKELQKIVSAEVQKSNQESKENAAARRACPLSPSLSGPRPLP